MFEHLGFKDFCIGLWKYKYLIIAVTLVVTLVFGVLVCGKTIVGEEEPYYINEKIVCFKNDDIPKDTTAGYTVNKLAEISSFSRGGHHICYRKNRGQLFRGFY